MAEGFRAEDAPFVEWTPERVDTGDRALQVLAADADGLYGAGVGCCARLGPDGRWEGLGEEEPLLRKGITALLPDGPGRLWAAVGGGLAAFGPSGWRVTDDAFGRGWGGALALAAEGEWLWAGFSGGVLARRARLPEGEGLAERAALPGAVRAVVAAPHGLLLASDAGLYTYPADAVPQRVCTLPARTLLPWDGGWLCGTADGLLAVDAGGACGRPALDAALPVRDVRGLAATAGGVLWAATGEGLLRYEGGAWHYHQGPRWLPADAVFAVAAAGGDVHAATSAGLARQRPRPMTLEARADALLHRLRARHLRLEAFVEETVDGRPALSDNDGLWTGMYLAAECHRFAATGAADARAHADAAFAALEWLEAVTTIPGYPAKAIVAADGARPADGQWYPSAGGQWLWKGNCSSDEIVGHMYAYALYYDLVADGPARERVAAQVRSIMGHIQGHGLRILEFGGRTRWGYWNPEAVNGPEGMWGDRGLNSLEILSHLRVALHVTGEARYGQAYRELVEVHGYARNTLFCKVDVPGHVNHSDDELAFLAYEPLLRYERDPALRQVYLESLRRSWAFERPERNPLWNFIYARAVGDAGSNAGGGVGADTGAPGGGADAAIGAGAEEDAAGGRVAGALADAVRTLREIPTDTVVWPVVNSHRADVTLSPRPDRHGRPEITRVLPYDELAVARWNGNPYQPDAGDAHVEGDGVHFLLPYWMARHHGWIGPGTEV